MAHHVFGIRHHGPGSARSLRDALACLQPDMVLIEGPPEGDNLIALAARDDMRPPVAMLIYNPESPAQALYYPFAIFSPEWQAIHYALQAEVPARFIDLPVAHRLALDNEREQRKNETPAEPLEKENSETSNAVPLHRDPLHYLALAAGYSDSERWWEHMVEERRDSASLFQAIGEAMSALRADPVAHERDEDAGRIEELREAHMRKSVRAAEKEGYQRIAIICGAWHAPALTDMPAAKHDTALLKGLPSVKTQATWVPWSYGRLTYASGYGAGVISPGWYHHLWETEEKIAVRWMIQVAHRLRENGLDVSSAHVIEAVRLSETLAAMRGRPLPGLPELNDAAQSVLLFGETLPLRLIHDTLIIGERLGEVPDDAPLTPLQRDFAQQQKSLRIKADPADRELILDLRESNDLARSRLLRRLMLLDLPWGKGGERARGKGTFKERWRLQWQPEFAIKLIEAGIWGNSVEEAATALALHLASKSGDLPQLTRLAREVMYADLGDALGAVMLRLQSEAALSGDVTHLIRALPELAQLLRYGDVRKTATDLVEKVVTGLVTRICVGVPPACSGLNDEAAEEMFGDLEAVNGAITLLDNVIYSTEWRTTLGQLLDQRQVHGILQGRACRLLLDAGELHEEEAARRLAFALSTANDPAQSAAWVDGFLRGNGQLLIYDEALWDLIDSWISDLSGENFTHLLPLLRRTFATFTAPERRAMGERVRLGRTVRPLTTRTEADFDAGRAERVLPLVATMLGLAEA